MNPAFILHLRGSMQSYGDEGFGPIRSAGLFPTRSAVLGIVSAALGVPRYDPRLVRLHKAIKVHAAVERAGSVRTDFHTVNTGAAYEAVTYRDYLHDARFVVLLEARTTKHAPVIDEARTALMRPYYASWLGRKSCVPSRPLVPESVEGKTVVESLARAVNFSAKPVMMYLDGRWSEDQISSAGAKLEGRGQRRDLLVYPRRTYVNRDYTAVSVSVDQHAEYFDALR